MRKHTYWKTYNEYLEWSETPINNPSYKINYKKRFNKKSMIHFPLNDINTSIHIKFID
mgnify:CR=1 FL=1|jgi:hypothetical protein